MGASGVKTRISTSCVSNGAYHAQRPLPVWYLHFGQLADQCAAGALAAHVRVSEEKDLHYAISKKLISRRRRRLWGTTLAAPAMEQELSKILVETPVQDDQDRERPFAIQAQPVGITRRKTTSLTVWSALA